MRRHDLFRRVALAGTQSSSWAKYRASAPGRRHGSRLRTDSCAQPGVNEAVTRPGGVRAHENLVLRARRVVTHPVAHLGTPGNWSMASAQDLHVIVGVVGPGVAGPQHSGEGFLGLVQIPNQRVEAEAPLIGGCRVLFVRVRGEQRGVDVDRDGVRSGPEGPGPLSGDLARRQ